MKYFIDESVNNLHYPQDEYGLMFIPNKEIIEIKNCKIIFCKTDAKLVGNFETIYRGNWTLQEGYIYRNANKTYKSSIDKIAHSLSILWEKSNPASINKTGEKIRD